MGTTTDKIEGKPAQAGGTLHDDKPPVADAVVEEKKADTERAITRIGKKLKSVVRKLAGSH